VVNDLSEATVWIVAHEAFHWLRMTRQISGRNTEIEADAFADKMLDEFRHSPCTSAEQDEHGEQLTFWEIDAAAPVAH